MGDGSKSQTVAVLHDLEASIPIGAFAQTDGDAVGLVCREIWGGNRAFHGPVELT